MLVIGVTTAVVFSILIAAGLYVTRQAMVSAGNSLGDSAAEDARQLLINHAEEELSRTAQSMAAINDEKLSVTAENVRIISQIATTIKSNPARYGRREISFPDTSNREGRITASVQIPEGTTFSMLQSEIGLMANIQDTLLAMQTNNRNVGTTYIATESGITIGANADSAPGTPYFEPRTRPWYIAANQANDLIWTDVFEDYLGRGLAITCTKPFYDINGRIAGVAGMGMYLNVLKEILTEAEIGETAYVFIINKKGEIIISDSEQKDENSKIIRGNILESGIFPREMALKMTNGERGIDHVIMDGKEKLVAYHGLRTIPWSLVIITDAEEIISPALMLEDNIIDLKEATLEIFDQDIMWIAIIAGIILIFIITGVMTLTGRLTMDITEPIEQLSIEAARIGAGDLNHVLEVKTGDELELLAASFNAMIAGIKAITAEKERLETASVEKTYETQIIQESHQNLQSILDMLPAGVGVMSMEDSSILFSNKALLDVLNCTSSAQVLGHSGFEFMPVIQPDGRKTADLVADVFQKESAVTELQFVKSGGEPFTARIHSINTIFKGSRAVIAVIEDITAEKNPGGI
jgi:sigma-B regulation protein RsbU (phosphoserine phosphatase)